MNPVLCEAYSGIKTTSEFEKRVFDNLFGEIKTPARKRINRKRIIFTAAALVVTIVASVFTISYMQHKDDIIINSGKELEINFPQSDNATVNAVMVDRAYPYEYNLYAFTPNWYDLKFDGNGINQNSIYPALAIVMEANKDNASMKFPVEIQITPENAEGWTVPESYTLLNESHDYSSYLSWLTRDEIFALSTLDKFSIRLISPGVKIESELYNDKVDESLIMAATYSSEDDLLGVEVRLKYSDDIENYDSLQDEIVAYGKNWAKENGYSNELISIKTYKSYDYCFATVLLSINKSQILDLQEVPSIYEQIYYTSLYQYSDNKLAQMESAGYEHGAEEEYIEYRIEFSKSVTGCYGYAYYLALGGDSEYYVESNGSLGMMLR